MTNSKDDVEIKVTEGPLDIEVELTKVYHACKNGRLRLDILTAIDSMRYDAKLADSVEAETIKAELTDHPALVVPVEKPGPVAGQDLPRQSIAPPGYFTPRHDKVIGSVISPKGVQCDFATAEEFNVIQFIKEVPNDFLFIDNWELCSSFRGVIETVCKVTANSYLPSYVFIKAA